MSESWTHLVLLSDLGVLVLASDGTGTLVSLDTAEDLCTMAGQRNEPVLVSCHPGDETSPAFRRLKATGSTVYRAEPWVREGSQGMSSLMFAAVLGDLSVVEDLVGRGADVEARDDAGRTALLHAARAGRAAVVDRLLGAGASHDVADRVGSTALIEAARQGHRSVVVSLMRAGADPAAAMKGAGSARALAAAAGHTEVVAALPADLRSLRSGVRLPGERGALASVPDGVTFIPRQPSNWITAAVAVAAVVGIVALAVFVAVDTALGVLVMVAIALFLWFGAFAPIRFAVGPSGVFYRPGTSSVLEIPWSAMSEIMMLDLLRTRIGFVTDEAPLFISGPRAGRSVTRSLYAGRIADGRWVTTIPLRLFSRAAVMTALAYRTVGTGVRRPDEFDDWL